MGLAALFVFTAAFAHLQRTYEQKFFDATGRAQWIWARHPISANVPLAFYASRELDLPEHRVYTRLKVMGDPEFTVFVNGRELAGRRVSAEEHALDVYDISEMVKTGRNRVVVGVRAPQGLGGLLAAIDIGPETENWIVSDRDWKIHRRWSPELLMRDPADGQSESPMILGEPPVGRWNYLTPVPRPVLPPPATALPAQQSFSMVGLIPTIRTRAGIAVAGADRARATVFDFGFTKGHLRLTRESDSLTSQEVRVRFANAREELGLIEQNLRSVVFAPGEKTVTTPEKHSFRYAMVYARGAVMAEVVN